MGAEFLLLALAARTRAESQRRYDEQRRRREQDDRRRREQLRKKEDERRKKSGVGSLYSYDSGTRYSFEEHIRKIVSENPTYRKYIEALYDEGTTIDSSKKSDIERRFEELVPGILDQEKMIQDLQDQIEKTGIAITDQDKLGSMRVDREDTRYLYTYNIGSHTYSYGGHPITFNGIRIDEDILSSDGRVYQVDYDRAVENNPDVDTMLNREIKMLSRQESIKKLPFMDTYSRDMKIRDLRSDIRHHENVQQEIAVKKQKVDTFKSLTPEQRELIGKYLAAVQKYRELMKPAVAIIDEYRDFDSIRRPAGDIKAKWEQASKKAMESGKITEDDERMFYEMLQGEIANMKTSYPEGMTAYGSNSAKELGTDGPLTWLVKYGAIEYARTEKERLKTEEKTLDEAAALAEKRDSLMQGEKPAEAVEEKKEEDKKEEEKRAEDGEVK